MLDLDVVGEGGEGELEELESEGSLLCVCLGGGGGQSEDVEVRREGARCGWDGEGEEGRERSEWGRW